MTIHLRVGSAGDTEPPQVSITFPAAACYNASSWGPITGTATDNVGVTMVEVYVDDYKVGDADLTYLPNWSLSYTPTEGVHTLYAIAYDAAGNYTQSDTVSFTYDITPPEVTITVPANNGMYILGQTYYYNFSVTDNIGPVTYQTKLDGNVVSINMRSRIQ